MLKLNLFGRGLSLQIAVVVACQMAFILFGYDQGVFSGIVGNEDFLDRFNHPSSALEGIIVSIYNLGAFSGCIINFFTAEATGRRLAMWIAMLFIIVGAALQCSSFSLPQLMIARYITGIGTGIETSTVPMYQSELCDANKRGRLVSSEPLFVGVGIVIAYWFDYGMSFTGTSLAWRLPIACQMIFAFFVIALVLGLPESPRYLYGVGKSKEALAIICDVYDLPPESERVQREQNDILEVLELERKHGQYRWSQLLKRDDVQTGKRVLLAYGMQFMNQMGGINLVVYYITSVLQSNVGLSRNLSLLLGGVINCMFPIGSLVPTFFLDKFGRRSMMMWGSLGLALSMMMISILLSFQGTTIEHNTASAAVAFFFTYMLIFGASVNCIPWVYVPEILPLRARAKGTAVAISANWLWNFFVVMITPTLITDLAWKAYLIFMCLNAAFIPLVFFCYPETSNITLEDMDLLFTDKQATTETHQQREVRGWGRSEEVMRSLDRDSLGILRQHRRSSVGLEGDGFAGGEKQGANHVEQLV